MSVSLPNPATGVQTAAAPPMKWRWWDQVDRSPAECLAAIRECRRIGDQLARDIQWSRPAGTSRRRWVQDMVRSFSRPLRVPVSAVKQELRRRIDPAPPGTESGFVRKVTAHMWAMLHHGFSAEDCEKFGVGSRIISCQPALVLTLSWAWDLRQHLAKLAPPRAADDFRALLDKTAFACRCVESALPGIPVVATFTGGQPDPRFPAQTAAALPEGDLVVKPIDGGGGEGVRLWRGLAAGIWTNSAGERAGRDELWKRLLQESRQVALLVQPRASNHRELAASGSGALCTVRLVTCLHPDGHCELLPPVLRLGSGNGIVDNLQGGGMAAPLNPLTGQICGPAVRFRDSGRVERLENHPDSGVALRSVTVPEWETVVQTAVAAQGAFRHWPFVGWDIAVTETGVVLVEGNAVWGTEVTQLPAGVPLGLTGFPAAYLAWREAWLQTGRVQASR
jgi:hypothetical protein